MRRAANPISGDDAEPTFDATGKWTKVGHFKLPEVGHLNLPLTR